MLLSSEGRGSAIEELKRADEDLALADMRMARTTMLGEEERRGEGGEEKAVAKTAMETAATAEMTAVGGEYPQKKDKEEEGGGRRCCRRSHPGRFLILFCGIGIIGGDEIVLVQINLASNHPPHVWERDLHLLLLVLLLLLIILLCRRQEPPPPPPSWMLPKAWKAAEGTTKAMVTATATNADVMARYRTTDFRNIDPASRRSCRVGSSGSRGGGGKGVRSQGSEGTANSELGRFLAELEDEECKKNNYNG